MASAVALQRWVRLFGAIWVAAAGCLFFLAIRSVRTILAYQITNPDLYTLSGSLPLILAAMACTAFGIIALLNGLLLIRSKSSDPRNLWMTAVLFLIFPIGTVIAVATLALMHKREVRQRADREMANRPRPEPPGE